MPFKIFCFFLVRICVLIHVRLFVPMLGFMLRLTLICYEPSYPTYPMSLDVDYDQLYIHIYRQSTTNALIDMVLNILNFTIQKDASYIVGCLLSARKCLTTFILN